MTTAVYRITKERYRDQIFSGLGGLYASGRWTSRGHPVVYTSESISLAILEYALNYKRHGWIPASVLARATIPDDMGIESVSIAALPDDWRAANPPSSLRDIGQGWLHRAETACLRVPSAIVPEESNYLLNPRHPDFARLMLGYAEPINFDRRLARTRGTRGKPAARAGVTRESAAAARASPAAAARGSDDSDPSR